MTNHPPGQRNVSTTMLYTHVLNRGGTGVQSQADRLMKSWNDDFQPG
ncbi:MAG TPA: hypothetical protein VFK65_05015 [Candidatus Binatia bacterium]|nr:hypothetical protein [Candidatus Binatia bacterium]